MIGHLPGLTTPPGQHDDERRRIDALGVHTPADAAVGVELRLLLLDREHAAGAQRGEEGRAQRNFHWDIPVGLWASSALSRTAVPGSAARGDYGKGSNPAHCQER